MWTSRVEEEDSYGGSNHKPFVAYVNEQVLLSKQGFPRRFASDQAAAIAAAKHVDKLRKTIVSK